MDDLVQFFSLTLVDLIDNAFQVPLWKLLAWAIAVALSTAMITTLASSGGERVKALIYIGLGLMIVVEIFRPVDWSMFFGLGEQRPTNLQIENVGEATPNPSRLLAWRGQRETGGRTAAGSSYAPQE